MAHLISPETNLFIFLIILSLIGLKTGFRSVFLLFLLSMLMGSLLLLLGKPGAAGNIYGYSYLILLVGWVFYSTARQK